MKFNFNQLVNEKYALKAFSRGTKDNNLLSDLNNKLLLGMNLPSSDTFPKVGINKKPVSKINSSLTWKLISSSENNQTKIESYIQKPLLDAEPSNVFFYRRSFVRRRKKSFLVYQENNKGSLRQLSVRSRFLKFKKSFIQKSSLSSKMYYLRFHKDTNFLFHKPKVSCVSSKLYTNFDKKSKQIDIRFNSNYMILSEFQVYSGIANKLKNLKKTSLENYKYSIILKYLNTKKELNLNANEKSYLVLKIAKQLSESKSKTFKQSIENSVLSKNLDSDISTQKSIFQKYIDLNEKNKETVKKAIKAANFETIKSDLFKIRAEQFSKYPTKFKFSKRQRFKKYNKGKDKKLCSNNFRLFSDIFRGFQKDSSKKPARSFTKKPRFDRKFEIKPKLSFKSKNSKI